MGDYFVQTDTLKNVLLRKTIFIVFANLFIVTNVLWGQSTEQTSIKISDCFGALALSKSGGHNVAFPATAGTYDDVEKYADQLTLPETNSVWFRFKAPFAGVLDIESVAKECSFEFAMFSPKEMDCKDLAAGTAELLFAREYKDGHLKLTHQEFSFLKLKEGQLVTFMFNSVEEHNKRLDLKVEFLPENHEATVKEMMNLADLRRDETLPSYRIAVRDAVTKLPVESKIIIKESKFFDAFYNASDLLFTLDRSLRFELSVDAYGYFPADSSIKIRDFEGDVETIIEVIPVMEGSRMKLEGIGFMPQSDVFTEDAELKMQRLRDFMGLNSTVVIEVHGHVHSMGANTFRAKKLSRKRAKRVVNYLIAAGIEKDRMTYKGFGNSEMLYPEAKTVEEEQANRRVEIKVVSIGEIEE